MFCHNAYPKIPKGHDHPGAEPVLGAALPAGIDCQRCHGPGGNILNREEARRSSIPPGFRRNGRSRSARSAISRPPPLPDSIRRFDRAPFSYRAGEPLGDFTLFFNHAPGSGRDGKFEIVNAAYRLR